MDNSQLETFLAVIEYKNYSKAAEFLNVTQPTVTARIKNLENELSCKLFDRDKKNFTLSKEGKVFVEYATSILTYMDHSKEATLASMHPSIKIGFSPGFSYSFITELISSISLIDNLDISIIEGEDSTRLNEQIISGELDVVFNRNAIAHKPDLISEYLFDDKLVLICGENHRLAKHEKISLNDLQGETLIFYRPHAPLMTAVVQEFIGIPNIKRIEVGNNEMLKKIVTCGLGIGLTLALGIEDGEKSKLVVKNLKELGKVQNKVYVQYRRNLLLEKSVKKIIYSFINHELKS